jgi:hypothetical protein
MVATIANQDDFGTPFLRQRRQHCCSSIAAKKPVYLSNGHYSERQLRRILRMPLAEEQTEAFEELRAAVDASKRAIRSEPTG